MRQGFLFLTLAIIGEATATTALKATDGFTKILPATIVVIGYASAIYCLSLTMRSVPVGMAYSIWAGAGTALIALFSFIVYRQMLDARAVLGMMLIVAGIALVNSSASFPD